jgi:hypothetical protein
MDIVFLPSFPLDGWMDGQERVTTFSAQSREREREIEKQETIFQTLCHFEVRGNKGTVWRWFKGNESFLSDPFILFVTHWEGPRVEDGREVRRITSCGNWLVWWRAKLLSPFLELTISSQRYI